MELDKALLNPKSPYELESSFDRRALQSPDGRRKAQLFAALIPAGCRTILDAGGGTGWATIGLRDKYHVVTVDSSAKSLSHASGATILANVEDLPFADRSFDVVISSQVLEHLPDGVLDRARSEMMRVARKYLLVSVPYREALEVRFVRCGFCQHVFHPYYHCRSFTEKDLAELFPQWLMAEWHVFGDLRRGSGVTALRRPPRVGLMRDLPFATEETICPECGKQGGGNRAHQSTNREGIVHRILSSSKRRLRRRLSLREVEPYATFLPQALAPYWIAALFIRERGASPVDGDLANFSGGRRSSGDR
jgi:SAM-dependent methyltransferase